jgi:hypothetical protein
MSPGELKSSTQCELPRQYSQRPRAELDGPILAPLVCGSGAPPAALSFARAEGSMSQVLSLAAKPKAREANEDLRT